MRKIEIIIIFLIIILPILLVLLPKLLKKAEINYRSDIVGPKMKIIEGAINAYKINTGELPGELMDLISAPNSSEKQWRGPYLKEISLYDPWKNMYIYIPDNNTGNYTLISYGGDGKPGGEGENEDIYND